MTTDKLSTEAAHARAHLTDAHAGELADLSELYGLALDELDMARSVLYDAIIEAREVFTIREIAERTGLSSARIAQITKESR